MSLDSFFPYKMKIKDKMKQLVHSLKERPEAYAPLLLLIIISVITLPETIGRLDNILDSLHNMVSWAGFYVVLPSIGLIYLCQSILLYRRPNLYTLLFTLSAYTFSLNIALMILKTYDSQLIVWFQSSINASAVVTLSLSLLIVVYMVAYAIPIIIPTDEITAVNAAKIALKHSSEIPLNYFDKQAVISHEVGHALLFARFEKLEDGTRVLIEKSTFQKHYTGRVVDTTSQLGRGDERLHYWSMVMLLAGKQCEKSLGYSPLLGSVDDYTRWQHRARQYLSQSDDEYPYFVQPMNSYEHQSNMESMERLKNEQLQLLEDIFKDNKAVIKMMIQHLNAYESMETNVLAEFLKHVRIPASLMVNTVVNDKGSQA